MFMQLNYPVDWIIWNPFTRHCNMCFADLRWLWFVVGSFFCREWVGWGDGNRWTRSGEFDNSFQFIIILFKVLLITLGTMGWLLEYKY